MLKIKLKKSAKLFVIGGTGYGLLEILWRGKTHWSMVLLGGTCFVWLTSLFKKCSKMKMPKKCLLGSAVITFCEFVCGCIVNLKFKMNVWDYSNCKFNIKGQICPFYSMLWALLCIPISTVCTLVSKKKVEKC